MKLWIAHPTGNSVVRALLAAFANAGFDYRFFSTLAFSDSEGWIKHLPAKLKSELVRRTYKISPHRLRRRPAREIVRLILEKVLRRTMGERNPFSPDSVYQDLDRAVAARLGSGDDLPDVLYAFEDGASDSFKAAASCGVRRIYDLPIAYWETSRRILAGEALRLPRWAPTLEITCASKEKLARKTEEIELADVVICPSQFVHDSIPPKIRAQKPCLISAFGTPTISPRPRPENKKLRVLFVGLMTQRKGLADVLAAFRMIGSEQIELVVLGRRFMPMNFYREEFSGFIYEPPRSHSAALELMQSCDVLVLPSLVEGRAVVQHEALACGLPLIVTRNAGAEDMVREEETGFLVAPSSPAEIAEKIEWFASHRSSIKEMRELCRATAAQYTWEAYAQRIFEGISSAEPVLS